MYEEFVQTQMMLLKSERCVDMAMHSPRWLANDKRSNAKEAGAEFIKKLDVAKDKEIIRVSYSDSNPETAQDAVSAIIEAYQMLSVDIDPDQPLRKQARLEQLKSDYEKKLENARNDISAIAAPNLPSSLMNRYEYKMTESNQAETDYRHAQRAVDEWKIFHAEPATPAVDGDLAKLEAKAELYQRLWTELEQETVDLGHRAAKIKEIEAEQAQNKQWLAETKQALEELRVQLNSAGRIVIISLGDRPILLQRLGWWTWGSGAGAFLVTLLIGGFAARRA